MSVRQYIGARYVPIFDGEWDNTKTYEPLTIVTVANVGSYISKKYVPVGIAITNTDYWALSANVSGQVTALTQRVDDIEDEIDTIGALAFPRRVVSLSDSYAERPTLSTSFATILGNILGLTSSDYYNLYQGSMGFYRVGSGGTNAADFLTSELGNISDLDTITDVIVTVGLNDYQETIANVETGIDNLISVIKNNFPIARIWMGFPGNSYTFTEAEHTNMINIIQSVQNKCGEHQCRFMSGLEHILHDNDNIGADAVHPTARGAQIIADAISTIINGGTFRYRRSIKTVLESVATSGLTSDCYMIIDGPTANIHFLPQNNSGSLSFASNAWVKVAELQNWFFRNVNCSHPLVAMDYSTNDPIIGVLLYVKGNLYIKTRNAGGGSRTAAPVIFDTSITFNTLDV